MSGLKHVETEVSVRDEYLRAVNAGRRLAGGDYTGRDDDKARDEELAGALVHPEFAAMGLEEEFILTVTADGMGKRSSAYDYRISKRGSSSWNPQQRLYCWSCYSVSHSYPPESHHWQ